MYPPPEFGLLGLLSEALRAGGFHWRGGLVNQLEKALAYSGQPSNFGSENEQRSAVAMAKSSNSSVVTCHNKAYRPGEVICE